jgi:hypothetical protein
MPNFTAGTSFTDGVTNDVTALKLNALVADAVPTSSLALNSTTGTISLFSSGTGTAATPAIQPAGDTNTGIFFPAADTIAFSEGGAESMRIDSNGNVGVANTTPSSFYSGANNLVIGSGSGEEGLTIYGGNASASYLAFADGTTGDQAYRGSVKYDHSVDAMSLQTGAAERLRIDSSGNVGIGTTSPSGPLHIRGAAGRYAFPATSGATQSNGLTLRLNDASDDNAILDIGGNSTSGYWLQATNNANLALNYPLLLNPNGGNVGIGTASPTSLLHVYNSANSGKLINIANPNTGTGAYAGFDALSDTVSLSVRPYGSTFNTFTHAGIALAGAAEIWADTISGSGPQALLMGIKTANPLILATNNTERLRIDSSGNVGIGSTAPNARLFVTAGSAPNNAQLLIGYLGGSENYFDANTHIFRNGNAAEAMRISSGNLLVGTTSANPSGASSDGRVVINTANGGQSALTCYNLGTGATNIISLENGNGQVGRIQISGSATSYLTSSDYRLKENVQPMTGALARVASLKPCTFKWKIDGTYGQGFVAHELKEVCPDAVGGEKDAVNADGKIEPQGIDQSKIVPLLTAAIKEAIAKIETLEVKVTALEAT